MQPQQFAPKGLIAPVTGNAKLVRYCERLNPGAEAFKQLRNFSSPAQARDGMGGVVIVAAHGVGVGAVFEQVTNRFELAVQHLLRQQEIENRLLLVRIPVGRVAGLEPVLRKDCQPLAQVLPKHGVVQGLALVGIGAGIKQQPHQIIGTGMRNACDGTALAFADSAGQGSEAT